MRPGRDRADSFTCSEPAHRQCTQRATARLAPQLYHGTSTTVYNTTTIPQSVRSGSAPQPLRVRAETRGVRSRPRGRSRRPPRNGVPRPVFRAPSPRCRCFRVHSEQVPVPILLMYQGPRMVFAYFTSPSASIGRPSSPQGLESSRLASVARTTARYAPGCSRQCHRPGVVGLSSAPLRVAVRRAEAHRGARQQRHAATALVPNSKRV